MTEHGIDVNAVWGRIYEALEKTGLSASEFARRAGIYRTTLYNAQKNGHLPSTYTIAAICRVTGVSADWIIGL